MFTKSIDILSNELWNVLHSDTGDGIVSTRNYTRVPKTGYAVDIHVLQAPGRLDAQTLRDWVELHRLSIDYVPNAYIGAHRSIECGDSVYEVHIFGEHEAARLFAKRMQAGYIYSLESLSKLLDLAANIKNDHDFVFAASELGYITITEEEA